MATFLAHAWELNYSQMPVNATKSTWTVIMMVSIKTIVVVVIIVMMMDMSADLRADCRQMEM